MNHEYHQPQQETQAEVGALERVFAKELSSSLAHAYMQTVTQQLGGLEQSYAAFVEKGNRLHEYVGHTIYGPLIVGYCQWVRAYCQDIGYTGTVHMALRDAAPLLVAADILWKNTELTPHGIYVNRPILGIEDEIAKDTTGFDAHIFHYLAQHGIQPDGKLVLCDSGAWGTVVKEMKQKLLPTTQFFPLFWFSHNPHIPGYLNTLLSELGKEEVVGEIINDSIECTFPQCVERPTKTTPSASGSIDVVLTPSTHLAKSWGASALVGVAHAAEEFPQGISHDAELAALTHIIALSEHAAKTKTWTGVLPTHTPTWSHGEQFLSEWPADLLP